MAADQTVTEPATGDTTGTGELNEVFVGGPFYNLVDPKTGEMSEADQQKFTRLIDYFEQRGAKVYNAHRREAWGKEFLTAFECTKLDLEEISRSDLFIAYPGVPASAGTHVEIGWASALGKRMILLLEKDKKHAFLVTGLESIANVEFIWFDDPQEIFDQLEDALRRVLHRDGPAGSRG